VVVVQQIQTTIKMPWRIFYFYFKKYMVYGIGSSQVQFILQVGQIRDKNIVVLNAEEN